MGKAGESEAVPIKAKRAAKRAAAVPAQAVASFRSSKSQETMAPMSRHKGLARANARRPCCDTLGQPSVESLGVDPVADQVEPDLAKVRHAFKAGETALGFLEVGHGHADIGPQLWPERADDAVRERLHKTGGRPRPTIADDVVNVEAIDVAGVEARDHGPRPGLDEPAGTPFGR